MELFSRLIDGVKYIIKGQKTRDAVLNSDINLRRQLIGARLQPHHQQKIQEIAYKEKELRTLLKNTYEEGIAMQGSIESFRHLFTRNFTPLNAFAWKEKLGKEIVSPAIGYLDKIERIRQLNGPGIEGNPVLDMQKLQAYRQTLAAVADKDFRDSGNLFLENLLRSVKSRQNQAIKLLAMKVDRIETSFTPL